MVTAIAKPGVGGGLSSHLEFNKDAVPSLNTNSYKGQIPLTPA